MASILLVEDDPVLGRGLVVRLELEGYSVTWARDLRSAREATAAGGRFDVMVLDLGLPDGSGREFCAELRNGGSALPILILTAQTDEDSVVAGLGAGANDYVRKPFGHRELLARIKGMLRASTTQVVSAGAAVLKYGELEIVVERRKALCGEREIEFNRREFDILKFLVERADGVVTRDALLGTLDKDGEIFDRTIDSHVSHIRAKLKQAGVKSIHIAAVYGVGYRLEKR